MTGASAGIGAEMAKQLAALGADVVITARREERLKALAREIVAVSDVEVQVEAMDLCDPGAPQALFDRTEGAHKSIDLLINNAGFGAYDDFLEIPWPRHEAMLQLHIVTLSHLIHLFTPAMVRRHRGRIINIASIAAYTPSPTLAVYAASKAYVLNFTEALTCELKGTGVTATSVCPGGTRTEFLGLAGLTLKKTGETFMMSAAACARIAIAKALAGRSSVITGFLNALLIFLLRWLPRSWLAPLALKTLDACVQQSNREPST